MTGAGGRGIMAGIGGQGIIGRGGMGRAAAGGNYARAEEHDEEENQRPTNTNQGAGQAKRIGGNGGFEAFQGNGVRIG